eukprot:1159502-Pelagomonas_calceolata.AAC.2
MTCAVARQAIESLSACWATAAQRNMVACLAMALAMAFSGTANEICGHLRVMAYSGTVNEICSHLHDWDLVACRVVASLIETLTGRRNYLMPNGRHAQFHSRCLRAHMNHAHFYG